MQLTIEDLKQGENFVVSNIVCNPSTPQNVLSLVLDNIGADEEKSLAQEGSIAVFHYTSHKQMILPDHHRSDARPCSEGWTAELLRGGVRR